MASNEDEQELEIWLPCGATSLEAGDLVWEIRPDGKFHVFARGLGRHLTIQPGAISGVVDAHVTSDTTHEQEPVGAMRHEDIAGSWEELAPLVERALSRIPVRRLRRSRIRQRQIVVLSGVLPVGNELLPITHRKGRRLRLDEKLYRKSIKLQSPLAEVAVGKPLFLARQGGRRLRVFGLACRRSDCGEILWIDLRDLREFVRRMERLLSDLGTQYLLSLEEYKRYWAEATRDGPRPALTFNEWRETQGDPPRRPTTEDPALSDPHGSDL